MVCDSLDAPSFTTEIDSKGYAFGSACDAVADELEAAARDGYAGVTGGRAASVVVDEWLLQLIAVIEQSGLPDGPKRFGATLFRRVLADDEIVKSIGEIAADNAEEQAKAVSA